MSQLWKSVCAVAVCALTVGIGAIAGCDKQGGDASGGASGGSGATGGKIKVGFLVKQLFFLRKGFGKEYAAGLLEGIRTRKQLEKAKLKEVPCLRYLSIELRLIDQTLEYVLQLSRKYTAKARG